MITTMKSEYEDILQNNKEFDEVFQNSIRLEKQINKSGTAIEKELQKVEILINNYDESTASKSRDKTLRRSCKCQQGKKCKCGDNCQCMSLKPTNNSDSKQNHFDSKDLSDPSSLPKSRRKNWYLPWSNKKKFKHKDTHFNKTSNFKGKRRTHLKGELSPNSPKDKEMIEIFANSNDKHSIQEKLVFPNPLLVNNCNTSINNFEYRESVADLKNRGNSNIYTNQMLLSQQQKRGSCVSSEDYSIFKIQNSNKYSKLKKQNRKDERATFNGTKTNLKSPEVKEKRNILDKIWNSFRLKSSKISQVQSDEETYPNVKNLYFDLNEEMGQSNITSNVNNFLSTEPYCLAKNQVDDLGKKIKTINIEQTEKQSKKNSTLNHPVTP